MILESGSMSIGYKMSVRVFFMFLFGIVLYSLIVLWYPNIMAEPSLRGICYFMNWVGILIFIVSVWSWFKETGELMCPYIIFLSFFFLFNYGQCVMWALGIHIDAEIGGFVYGFGEISTADVVKGQIFTCLMMYMFHMGALFCIKPKGSKKQLKGYMGQFKSIFLIGQILGVVAIPVTLFRAASALIISILYGYNALYYSEYASQGGWMMVVEYFFFPSLVCLLIGGKYQKKIRIFVYSFFGIYMILNLLAGDRGSWLIKLVVLIWLYIKFCNGEKLRLRQISKWAIISYVGIWALGIFVKLRDIGLQNIRAEDVHNALSVQNSPIVSAFFELGGSMNIVTMLLTYGEKIWTYGNSYILSIVGVLSTQMLTSLGLPFVLMDDWFSQDILGISWGMGFSMVGEAYLNGGLYLGPLYMLILGFIIGSVLYINKNTDLLHHPIRYVFVATSLHTINSFSRGSSYLYLKQWFYGTVIVCLFIYITCSMLKKRGAIGTELDGIVKKNDA